MSCFIRFRLFILAALLSCFGSVAFAQSDSHGIGVPPTRPVHAISVGVEFGYGADYQQGSFPSSGFFDNGQGNGFTGSVFAELQLNSYFSVGFKAGLDFKNTAGERGRFDTVISELNRQFDTVQGLPIDIRSNVKITYMTIAPKLYFRPFHSGLFLGFAPEISVLLNSNYTITRNLISTTETIQGTTYNDIRFANGTTTETVVNEQITDANTLLLSALFSVGYDINFGSFGIAPIVTYDYPFTTVRNSNENNWKIASLYGSVAIIFKL